MRKAAPVKYYSEEGEDTFFDVFKLFLKDPENGKIKGLSITEKKRLIRCNYAKNFMKANPTALQKDILSHLQKEFAVSRGTAFYDMQVARVAIGFDYNDNKLFWREYTTRSLVEEIERERKRNKPDIKAIIKAIDTLAEITGIKVDDASVIRREDYGSRNLVLLIKSENNHYYQNLDRLETNDPLVVESIIHDMIDDLQVELPEDHDETEIESGQAD